MDRPDPKNRSFPLKQLLREHAEDERLAEDLAQQAQTLMPPAIADAGVTPALPSPQEIEAWSVGNIVPPVRIARSTIKNWPRADRPRDKLLDRGASVLSDAELLSILLRTGAPGQNALDQARA